MSGLFDKVKASVSTEAIMLKIGEEGKAYGQGTRYNICPVCDVRSNLVFNVKSNGTAHCFQCGFTGSVIDLWSKMSGKDPVAAARELADEFGLNKPESERPVIKWKRPDPKHENQKTSERQDALKQAINRLRHALEKRLLSNPNPTARRYLVGERQITTDVVANAEQRGLVGYLPANPNEAQALLEEAVGRELLVKAGLMKQEAKKSAIAFRPLVFFMPGDTGAEFRLVREPKDDEPKSIRYGELSFPYWWKGETSSVIVVEGAIDLLSMVCLGEQSTVIALPGCQSWRSEWALRIQSKYGTKCFVLALDSDEAGDESAAKIAKGLVDAGLDHFRMRPSGEKKDWNDVLKFTNSKTILMAA